MTKSVGGARPSDTLCSHLAMKGAAPKAIQELAGHKSLTVTLRYMHLTEAALRETVRLLEERGGPLTRRPATGDLSPSGGEVEDDSGGANANASAMAEAGGDDTIEDVRGGVDSSSNGEVTAR